LAHEEKSNPKEPADSGALAKVDITIAKVDLRGIEKFKGVFDNAIKAISRGLGAWYEPILRVRNAEADRIVANENAQTIIVWHTSRLNSQDCKGNSESLQKLSKARRAVVPFHI
jgi:hypothetical protein